MLYVLLAAVALWGLATIYVAYRFREFRKFLAGAFFVSWGMQLALSRNPIYVAFWIIMLGQFLVFPNWLLLVYLGAATWLFHRQVLREEAYLIQHYGKEYSEYCARVRRYV